MTPVPRQHQLEFLNRNPDKVILAWGTRVGKQYTICWWAQKRPHTRFILACPKKLVAGWVADLALCGTKNVMVVSKEQLKKTPLHPFNGFIFDEAHWLASGLYEKPSKLTRHVYDWLRKHPEYPVLLASATPISSKPSNLHTLAALKGHYWDWKKYRSAMYELVKRPYAPWPFWEKKDDWRETIKPLAREVCDIVLLSDVMDMPDQKHEVVSVKLSDETRKNIKDFASANPSEEWYTRHRLAQGEEKLEKIRELSEGEPKVIVVCKYRAQLANYEKELSKDRLVLTLHGDTKDPGAIIKQAHGETELYFLVQADALEGFRGDSFNMMIFASMSWRTVALEQAYGRMLHLDKQSGNQYYYLIADEKDKDIYQHVVVDGREFSIAGIAESDD